jgi:PAS domain S-box-containing protein
MKPLHHDRVLLNAITKAQSTLVEGKDSANAFEILLEVLLTLTESEYGFIGEIKYTTKAIPYLKTHAITNIAWNEETRRFYSENAPQGLEFYNLETLFGAVIKTGVPVFANDPATDPRRGGLPKDHPPLNAFMGLPFHAHGDMIGMVGVANRPNGYDETVYQLLQPFLSTCGSIILSLRHQSNYQQTLAALQASEQALKNERSQLQAIFNSVLDGIITVDSSGIIQSVNPSVERIFNFKAHELIGNNVNMLMPEPYSSQHDHYIANYLQTRIAKVIGIGREVQGLRKDGTIFPVELAVTEVKLENQQLFTGIVRDITRRKVAEQQAREMLVELKRSHDDLLTILNQLRISNIIIDEEGYVTFMSESWAQLENLESKQALGQYWEAVCSFDIDSKEQLRQLLRTPEPERNRIPLTIEGTSGKRYWVEGEVQDYPRDPRRRIIFLYDITELQTLRKQLARNRYNLMIGNSEPMLHLYQKLHEVAQGDWTVLIEGETGSGKELVARSLHMGSSRKKGPFIAINCAGLSESLLTSQLFGHRRGAFTGAVADQEGLFEAASGGTLFLDEIGDIPMATQVSLLRVLQEREIIRVGDTKARKVDVRVIVATHRNLVDEVTKGHFRQDLLYRIRVARIYVPALRERSSDIPLLASAFLAECRLSSGKVVTDIDNQAMQKLVQHSWPGNVRELKNAIEYAVIHSRKPIIQTEDLPPEIWESNPPPPSTLEQAVMDLPAQDERSRILNALTKTNGNRSQAARLLGISRATFYRRLMELEIDLNQ